MKNLFFLKFCKKDRIKIHNILILGESSQSRTQDAAGNYAFAYNEQHGDGGSSRKESG